GVKWILDGSPIEHGIALRHAYASRPGYFGMLDLPPDTIRAVLLEARAAHEQIMLHAAGDSTAALVLSLLEQTGGAAAWAREREIYDSAALASLAPLQSLVERGIPLAFGADQNGDGMSPFLNIMVATTHPANPKEALTREQAVIAYTRGSAYAEGAEREKGTLAPGMWADLVVLSQDIFTVPAQALPATHSVLTIIGGRVAYDELTAATGPPSRD
ncbi:MAG TPA: amidohydrolase family protein, partial [Gemmatimonadaceae bacterium]|nr:amidohydrolase family protein [Gemmatimonadaceae bacterium]